MQPANETRFPDRQVDMVPIIGALVTLVALAAAEPAIKSTTKLSVISASRGVIEITAADVLELSHVYAGRFIGSRAESPDAQLVRHTVVFDIQTRDGVKEGGYAVQFVLDDSTGDAFIYLPGRGEAAYRANASTMIRDEQDGQWHRASPEWASLVSAYLR